MATFKSNLNSISRTYGLATLKHRIATCFHHWRSRAASEKHKFWTQHCHDYSYINKSAESAVNCKDHDSVLVNETAMTIMHETFLNLRDEYPDLNVEVRSILMARTQEGATISDIKDDYRKNTGIKFPIQHNITDFLLSIPSVTAYCNENGTLIFNVVPSSKTKHIYDLVQQQKSQQFHTQNQKRKGFPTGFNSVTATQNECDQLCYNQNKQFDCQCIDYDCSRNITPISNNTLQAEGLQEHQTHLQTAVPVEQKTTISDTGETAGNLYYQDNCNYLFNRLYNHSNVTPQKTVHNSSGIHQANLNDRFTNLHTTTKSINTASNQNQLNLQNHFNINNHEKLLNTFKQPASRSVPPNMSRTTSPSCTKSSRNNDSIYTSDMDYEAHLLDFPLMGDDFLLFLARMELRCKFRKYNKILQSGLCVSGLTISGAIRRIRQLDVQNKSIIVNIGSVDIMKGRPLVQIEHDFRELIKVMSKNGITPILTTLAPIANYAHDEQIKTKLERFNKFIKKEAHHLIVMDIWACLVNERGHILFDCFQNEPRLVTGTSEPYVFWNKIGRQRVLQLIESKLEY